MKEFLTNVAIGFTTLSIAMIGFGVHIQQNLQCWLIAGIPIAIYQIGRRLIAVNNNRGE